RRESQPRAGSGSGAQEWRHSAPEWGGRPPRRRWTRAESNGVAWDRSSPAFPRQRLEAGGLYGVVSRAHPLLEVFQRLLAADPSQRLGGGEALRRAPREPAPA